MNHSPFTIHYSLKRNLYFFLFLSAVSLGAAYLVYRLTSIAGSGVSADGAIYLSSAANLLKGRGLIDYYGRPLTLAPPFYPGILALLSFITRLDVYLIGWFLNILTFGLIVFFSGYIPNACSWPPSAASSWPPRPPWSIPPPASYPTPSSCCS